MTGATARGFGLGVALAVVLLSTSACTDKKKAALEAIKRAGKKERAAIMEAVRQTKDFEGVTGKFTFDENGDTDRTDMVGSAVKDGKFVYAESISAAMQCK